MRGVFLMHCQQFMKKKVQLNYEFNFCVNLQIIEKKNTFTYQFAKFKFVS